MKMPLDTLWPLLRAGLFVLDPEKAHQIACKGTKILDWLGCLPNQSDNEMKVPALGITFRNPLGLAAGFDKNAEYIKQWAKLGFGYCEVGTITLKPQEGNPKPRLVRDPETQSLWNRIGFNSAGADVVLRNLVEYRESQQDDFRIGVNLGKNRDTSVEKTPSEYGILAKRFAEVSDYLVINVSSPNTAGLREMQSQIHLNSILDEVENSLCSASKRPPILIKFAPELGSEELKELLSNLKLRKVGGVILTNTWRGPLDPSHPEEYLGGWSGGKLKEASERSLKLARSLTSLEIISVGGILSEEDALNRLENGANLLQIYSGWVYQGPEFPSRIVQFLKRHRT